MKSITMLLFLLFYVMVNSQSAEIAGLDTINFIDKNGNKKGKWVIKGMHYYTGRTKVVSEFRPDQVVETGMYVNNRKEGVWIEYHKNGKMRRKLTYINGVLNGEAAFYDETEKILKEGAFKDNKWIQ